MTAQFQLNPATFTSNHDIVEPPDHAIALPYPTNSIYKHFQVAGGHYYLASFCYTGQPFVMFSTAPTIDFFPSTLGYQTSLYLPANTSAAKCQIDAYAFYVPIGANDLYMLADNRSPNPVSIQDLSVRMMP